MKFDKKHYAYNSEGYFSLKGYINEVVGKDWNKRSFSMIIQAERNIGKSYGTWEFIADEIWEKSNYTEKVAYLRTNLEKVKNFISFFNAKFKGKYMIIGNMIYRVFFDDLGKEIKSQRIELGVVASLSSEENWRSGEFKNYRLIFWDEFNEENKVSRVFKKVINLFKTIERFQSNIIFLLMGNKIDGNNDILVKLEIEPDFSQPEDFCIEIEPPYVDELTNDRHRIYYVEIGSNTFKHLNQSNQGANIWAQFDRESNNFLNKGGYLNRHVNDVLIYRTRIAPTAQVKYYLSYGEFKFEYGTFERGIYFHEIPEIPQNAKCIALDVLGSMRFKDSKKYNDLQDYKEFAEMLSAKSKRKELFFTTFETKIMLETYILRLCSLTEF